MSTLQRSYCSCPTCTQLRSEKPKYYRYIQSFRDLFMCYSCFPNRRIEFNRQFDSIETSARSSTISFRDIDITHKHCSKHEVLAKATRPNLTRIQNEQLRQRVRDANQRWTRMSILPSNLIEFIYDHKERVPLCSTCQSSLSKMTFNLCHSCIRTLIAFKTIFNSNYDLTSSSDHETETFFIEKDPKSLTSYYSQESVI